MLEWCDLQRRVIVLSSLDKPFKFYAYFGLFWAERFNQTSFVLSVKDPSLTLEKSVNKVSIVLCKVLADSSSVAIALPCAFGLSDTEH